MSFGNFSQEDSMMSEINVTPLVDVMLVLLVVFIITAPLLAPQSLKVTLPRTDAATQQDKLNKVSLVIQPQGQMEIDQQVVTLDDLTSIFSESSKDPAFQLQVEADTAVPYGKVAEVLGLAQHAGVSRISFVTLKR
jgi:biopolymer transport protein ExbD